MANYMLLYNLLMKGYVDGMNVTERMCGGAECGTEGLTNRAYSPRRRYHTCLNHIICNSSGVLNTGARAWRIELNCCGMSAFWIDRVPDVSGKEVRHLETTTTTGVSGLHTYTHMD